MTSTLPSYHVSPLALAMQEREQALLSRAQHGEDVRDDIILHLQPTIHRLAIRFYAHLSPLARIEKAVEVADLVQAANVRMLARFPEALTKETPFGWLIGVSRYAMWDLVNGRGDLIKRTYEDPPILFLRLDAPLTDEGDTLADLIPVEVRLPAPNVEQAFTALEQAISVLPGKQRMVIERHFGLHEQKPRSLNQISRELSPHSPRSTIAHKRYKHAIEALRQALGGSFLPAQLVGGAS